MKTSISRYSSVKHSTGNSETMNKKKHRHHHRTKTSTGDHATITHFTGRVFDLKGQKKAREQKTTKHKPRQAA